MFNSDLEVTIHDVRTGCSNCTIDLNPCMGCVSRGNCDVEKYMEPGDFCRDKKARGDKNAE